LSILRDTGLIVEGWPIGLEGGGFAEVRLLRSIGQPDRLSLDIFAADGTQLQNDLIVATAPSARVFTEFGLVALKDGNVGMWYVRNNQDTNTDTLFYKPITRDGVFAEGTVVASASPTPDRNYTGVSADVLDNGEIAFAVNRFSSGTTAGTSNLLVFRVQIAPDGTRTVDPVSVEDTTGGWDGLAEVDALPGGGYVISSSFAELHGRFAIFEDVDGGILRITPSFNIYDADGNHLSRATDTSYFIAMGEWSGFGPAAYDLLTFPGGYTTGLYDGTFTSNWVENAVIEDRESVFDPVLTDGSYGYAIYNAQGGRGATLPLLPYLFNAGLGSHYGTVHRIDEDYGALLAERRYSRSGGGNDITVQLFSTPTSASTAEYAVEVDPSLQYVLALGVMPNGQVLVRGADASFRNYTQIFEIFGLVLEPSRLEENAAAGTEIGTLRAIGGLAEKALGFTLGGADAPKFTLGTGNILHVAAGADFDHEADDTASIVVTVTLVGGGTEEIALDIAVRDVNEAPTDIALSRQAFLLDLTRGDEFAVGQVLATLTTEDEDETNIPVYTLTANPENIFAIAGDKLVVADAAKLGGLTEPRSYSIGVKVTDEGGLEYTKLFKLDFVSDGKPVAVPDRFSYDSDTVVEQITIDVLANDIVVVGQKDPSSLTITVPPGYGTAAVAGGKILYTPGAQGFRDTVISYTFEDTTDQLSTTGTLRIARKTGVPDPFVVEGVTFQEVPDTAYAEATGTFTIGRKDGAAQMLQVVNGTIRAFEDRLEIIGGTTYSRLGLGVDAQFATKPLFAGDFTLMSDTGGGGVSDTLEPDFDDYTFITTEVAPSNIRLETDGIVLSGEFTLPDQFGAITFPALGLNGIRISDAGVGFAGGRIALPDAKALKLPFSDLALTTKGVALTSLSAERALKFEGTLTIEDRFFNEFLKPHLTPEIDARDRRGFTALTLDLGNATEPNGNFLQLREDPVQGTVFTGSGAISFPEIKLGGGFGIKDLTASLAILDESVTVGGGLKVALPFGRLGGTLTDPAYIGGSIKVILEPELALDEIALSSEIRIPIPQVPGLALRLVEMSAKGLASGPPANPSQSPFVLEGKIGFDYGGEISFTPVNDWLGFEKGVPVVGSLLNLELTGTAQVSRLTGAFQLDGSAKFFMLTPDFFTATLSNVPGKPLVNFYSGAIEAQGSFNFGSLLTGTGKLKADLIPGGSGDPSDPTGSANQSFIAASGTGTVTLPSARALGPLSGASGDAQFFAIVSFDGDSRNDYVAVTTAVTIGRGRTQLGGFQVSLDGEMEVFTGGRALPAVGSWEVAPALDYIIMTAQWENEQTGPVAVIVTYKAVIGGPVLATYTEADFAAAGIEVVADLTNAFAKTVAVFSPVAGVWDIEVVDAGGLGAISYGGQTAADPLAVTWLEVTRQDDPEPALFLRAEVNGADAGTAFDVFADTDKDGYDGLLIEGGLTAAQLAAGIAWELADAPSGDLFLYIVVREPDGELRVTPYRSEAVEGADVADLSVAFLPDATATDDATEVAHIIRVANSGADLARSVVITVQLPTEQYEVVSQPSGMVAPTLTGTTLRFTLPELAVRDAFEIVLKTFGTDGGPAANPVSVAVESAASDPDLTDNLALGAAEALPLLAMSDAVSGTEDTPISGEVLANDLRIIGRELTVSLLVRPEHGILALDPDGGFSYLPNADFADTDSFVYMLEDGLGASAAATVTITVAPQNDAPSALLLSGASVAETAAVGSTIGMLSVIDADEGDSRVFSLVDDGGGLFAILGDALVVAAPLDFEQAPSHPITLRVTDGGGLFLDRALTIVVEDVVAERSLGTAGADRLLGGIGNDTLSGDGGDDSLDGGPGADSMLGGAGNDSYVVDDAGDRVTETRTGGADKVQSSITWTLGAHLEDLMLTGEAVIDGRGNNLANVLVGNDAANVLDGGARADTLIGGGGDDLYLVDATDTLIEQAGGGNDTVMAYASFALPDHIEVLRFNGTANLRGDGNAWNNFILGNVGNNRLTGDDGNDTLNGGVGNDTLEGDEGADSLVGSEGVDLLDGGLGADTMRGGVGNDTYLVDESGDIVTEGPGAGADTVRSLVDFTLPEHVEALLLLAAGAGTGNGRANLLVGSDGADTLTGLAGADTLIGGLGDDVHVADWMDAIVELAGGGHDLVLAGRSLSLAALAEVEDLTLTGAAAANGAGNALDNRLAGNDGANRLSGGLGADTLTGGGGLDRLLGGAGDDVYLLDDADTVREFVGGGDDLVIASVSTTLTLHVENLTLTGSAPIDGTGNAARNVIAGNAAANRIEGMRGPDTLTGGEGDDIFRYATPTEGRDLITDFTPGADVFEIVAAGFGGGLVPGALDAARFVAHGSASATAAPGTGQFIFNTATGWLLYDADGRGGDGALRIAQLLGTPTLTAADIVLV
jgi:Ca2+-binding RTX toxin-like protein